MPFQNTFFSISVYMFNQKAFKNTSLARKAFQNAMILLGMSRLATSSCNEQTVVQMNINMLSLILTQSKHPTKIKVSSIIQVNNGIKINYTLGSPCEANTVRKRSKGYDPTVAAQPANDPLI